MKCRKKTHNFLANNDIQYSGGSRPGAKGGKGGGRFDFLALLAFSHFFFFIQNKGGAGPPGPSPRSTTAIYCQWICYKCFSSTFNYLKAVNYHKAELPSAGTLCLCFYDNVAIRYFAFKMSLSSIVRFKLYNLGCCMLVSLCIDIVYKPKELTLL